MYTFHQTVRLYARVRLFFKAVAAGEDFHLVAIVDGLSLGQANGADLRLGEDGRRDARVIDGDGVVTGDFLVNTDLDLNGQMTSDNTYVLFDTDGFMIPRISTDAGAPNSSLYFSSTGDGIAWKDENGNVHILATTTPP